MKWKIFKKVFFSKINVAESVVDEVDGLCASARKESQNLLFSAFLLLFSVTFESVEDSR